MWKKLALSRWLPWLLLLVTGVFVWQSKGSLNWEKVARQNAEAALDTTRSISTRHGEVYARIIAQKDVELAGALATAARLRRLQPVTSVGIGVQQRGIDTTVSHPVQTGVNRPAGSTATPERNVVRDSLVLAGPPIDGVVAVEVQDSTILWAARLRPSKIPLTLAVGCGKLGPETMVQGPLWVETEIVRGEIDPKVCNPPGSKFWTGVKYGAGATAAVVVTVAVLKIFKVL